LSEHALRDHRLERNRQLARNVAVGIAGRGANALVALVTVPLLLRLLGAERYGVYVTITAVMGWLQIGILGFGKGLVNTLVAAQVQGDVAEARRYVWSLWAGLAALVGAALLAAGAVFPFVPWSAVFPPAAGMGAAELDATVAIAIAFTLLALIFSPVAFVFTAYQEERVGSIWTALRNLATLPALGIVLALRGSMPQVALAVGLATVAVNLASFGWLLLRDKPFLRPRAGDVRRDYLSRALGASATFFALDLAAVLVYQTDKLLIIQFAGPRPVAVFEMASIVFLLAQSIFGVFLVPMWPALGEAIRRGDHAWARAVLGRFIGGSTVGMGAVVAATVALGPAAILWWTGHAEVVPGRLLILLVGLYFLVRTFTECHSIVLYSLDRQSELVGPTLANGILFVALGVVLGRAYGVLGVVVANVVGFAVTQGVMVPLRARRRLAALWEGSPSR
jgi:O-antigen/teichoic acid export membrane protein